MAESIEHVTVTGYGIPDNDPPGRAIAFPASDGYPTLHNEAGGAGTFDNPFTFATDPNRDFAPGTKLYLPHIQEYVIAEDLAASAVASASDKKWVDVWVGEVGGNDPNLTNQLASNITGDFTSGFDVIVNPDPGHVVDPTPFDLQLQPVDGGGGGGPGQFIPGTTGADKLAGTDGDDNIQGGDWTQPLNDGNDFIWAGAGNDDVSGMGGNDVLEGGSGADTFWFAEFETPTEHNGDWITDFVSGQDKINLDSRVFTNQSAVHFNFSDNTLYYGEFEIVHPTNGAVIVQSDLHFY